MLLNLECSHKEPESPVTVSKKVKIYAKISKFSSLKGSPQEAS